MSQSKLFSEIEAEELFFSNEYGSPVSDFGFSEDAHGFTRITNPERFNMWKKIGMAFAVLSGAYILKRMQKK